MVEQVLFVYLEECDAMISRHGVEPTVNSSPGVCVDPGSKTNTFDVIAVSYLEDLSLKAFQ